MANPKLADWVKSKLTEGYTSKEIKDSLIKEGYTDTEINDAMNPTASPVTQSSVKTKKFNIWPILIIGIIVVILIGAGLYFFVFHTEKPVTEIVNSTSDENVSLVDENGNIVGQMHVTTDIDVQVTTETGYEDFKQKFRTCQPTTSEYRLSDRMVYFLEILGPKDNLCQVRSKFTVNPNPAWVNKEMTCEYDNSLDYETAVQDMSKCSGELYNLMINPSSYQ